MIEMATITTTELATELDTTPRTLRKFLRSDESGIEGVGKGARYSIERKQIRTLKSRFAKWSEAQAAKANASSTDEEVDEVNED